ncbi:hypothetical protein JKP88DRAFT_255768 [Tribonema minus]|uniref:Uncharacterized protein n=1 Tax=Tribonema minus TaxID=303371 RepID=A0A835Z749_9STRA|nr:hypothetical protein JKP88DRAFT_255768 [Tribonema minus]
MATSKGATDRDVVDVLMAKLFTCKDAEDKKKFRHALIKTLVTASSAGLRGLRAAQARRGDGPVPELRSKLPRDDLVGLVGKVEMAKKVAPTHTRTLRGPHAPAFHMLMGPGIGFADSSCGVVRCMRTWQRRRRRWRTAVQLHIRDVPAQRCATAAAAVATCACAHDAT